MSSIFLRYVILVFYFNPLSHLENSTILFVIVFIIPQLFMG